MFLKSELTYNLNEGEEFQIEETTVIFDEIITTNEENYQALRANFLIIKGGDKVKKVNAGKNYYPVSKMITTEAGIMHEFFRDIYFILGEQKDNEWFIKVYINPLVSFIWFGVVIMVWAGFIGITKR